MGSNDHIEWIVVGSTEATSVLLESWAYEGEQGGFYLSGITMPEDMYHHCQVIKNNIVSFVYSCLRLVFLGVSE